MRHLKSLILLTMLTMTTSSALAQLEYKLELGGMLGMGQYAGDGDYGGFYSNNSFAGSLMARYNINPRMSLKFNLGTSRVTGDALKNASHYPEREGQEWAFSHQLFDLGCQYEISFWAFGTGKGYKGTKRLTPYIQVGFGFTLCNSTFTANIPVGFGIKYKLMDRLNVGLDWTMRFSMSDNLDGIKDPYNIDSGFMKNKDTYGWTMVYISYDLCPKLRKCNN